MRWFLVERVTLSVEFDLGSFNHNGVKKVWKH